MTLALYHALVTALRSEFMGGKHPTITSIRCPHLRGSPNKCYPIWILSYWLELTFVRLAQRHWRAADAHLLKCVSIWEGVDPEGMELVTQVRLSLEHLPWLSYTEGFVHDVIKSRSWSLARYASRDWLTDTQENELLELLERDLHEHRPDAKVNIQQVWFISSIRDAWNCRDTYATEPRFRKLRALGACFVHGAEGEIDQLGSIVNQGGNHWIAFVLDNLADRVYIGDSLGEGLAFPNSTKWLIWWTGHHTGRTFRCFRLAITRQIDGYSCGLLAWFALLVFFLKDQYSLPDASRVDQERLRVLLRILRAHHTVSSVSVSFLLFNHITGR